MVVISNFAASIFYCCKCLLYIPSATTLVAYKDYVVELFDLTTLSVFFVAEPLLIK